MVPSVILLLIVVLNLVFRRKILQVGSSLATSLVGEMDEETARRAEKRGYISFYLILLLIVVMAVIIPFIHLPG